MITKAQIKHIKSLDDKNYRLECQQFVVEGVKMLEELVASSWKIIQIYATAGWIEQHTESKYSHLPIQEITHDELKKISFLHTPNQVLSLVELPIQNPPLDVNAWQSHTYYMALDGIQDPGNMGTIIRIADWFGIKAIYCSAQCVDVFNPKVVQATMGSLFRIPIHRVELKSFLSSIEKKWLMASSLQGQNIATTNMPDRGILIIGNESKGIDPEILKLAEHQIKIESKGGAESLNAAVATGILCFQMTKKSN
ncbi:MAG: RNA methyltransferase [Chitinophagaceae bacterium]